MVIFGLKSPQLHINLGVILFSRVIVFVFSCFCFHLIVRVVCVSFRQLITTYTSILDDSDGKIYLISQIHQFKSGSSVCCRTRAL